MGNRLDLVQGTLEMLVLKSLGVHGELHGFGVLDWIRQSTGEELVVEEGALYPALHRMERRGWLSASWGTSEKGRRAKYYRLTKAGERALEASEIEWDRYVAAVAKVGAPEGRA